MDIHTHACAHERTFPKKNSEVFYASNPRIPQFPKFPKYSNVLLSLESENSQFPKVPKFPKYSNVL